MGEVQISSPRRLCGYLATPASPGPWPGVGVIQDAVGMTPGLRRRRNGWQVLGISRWHRIFTPRAASSAVSSLPSRASPEAGVLPSMTSTPPGPGSRPARLHRAHRSDRFLHGRRIRCRPGGRSWVRSLGCQLRGATQKRRGPARERLPDGGQLRARDRSVGDAPVRLRRILDGHGIDNDVNVFPGVGHSFMNNHPGKLATFAGAAGKDAAWPGCSPSSACSAGR